MNSPSCLSVSLHERCSSPFIILVCFHWTQSGMSLSLLYWGFKNCIQTTGGVSKRHLFFQLSSQRTKWIPDGWTRETKKLGREEKRGNPTYNSWSVGFFFHDWMSCMKDIYLFFHKHTGIFKCTHSYIWLMLGVVVWPWTEKSAFSLCGGEENGKKKAKIRGSGIRVV